MAENDDMPDGPARRPWPSPLLAATPYNRIPKAVYKKEYREEAVGSLVEQTVLYDLDDATLPGA
jgi:hypothetical protein